MTPRCNHTAYGTGISLIHYKVHDVIIVSVSVSSVDIASLLGKVRATAKAC